MILVRRRQDLKKDGLLIPTKYGGAMALDEWRPAFQPDELDGAEFNIILLDTAGFEMFDAGISIDFDFRDGYISQAGHYCSSCGTLPAGVVVFTDGDNDICINCERGDV